MFTINSYTSKSFIEDLRAKARERIITEETIKETIPWVLQRMQDDTNRNVYNYLKSISNNHPGVIFNNDHITLTKEAVLLFCDIYGITPYKED